MTTDRLEDTIRSAINSALPLALRGTLDDSMRLDAEGAGLDSVAIVELLLACEEASGVPFSADVLVGEPLTTERLIRHARTTIDRTTTS